MHCCCWDNVKTLGYTAGTQGTQRERLLMEPEGAGATLLEPRNPPHPSPLQKGKDALIPKSLIKLMHFSNRETENSNDSKLHQTKSKNNNLRSGWNKLKFACSCRVWQQKDRLLLSRLKNPIYPGNNLGLPRLDEKEEPSPLRFHRGCKR